METGQELDDLAKFNKERWDDLARLDVEYSRPMLDLDVESSLRFLDPDGVMDDVSGLNVLCLASGGGQQSVAFALLGADVTVVDLSETQLERDRLAADHYDVLVKTVHGDMRNLGMFSDNTFDIVYHAYSINFVPDIRPVHSGVARVLRNKGLYHLQWHNPFTQMIDEESWTGDGYLMNQTYTDGREINEIFPDWDVTDQDGAVHKIPGPQEFVHTLSTMLNSLVAHDFVIIHAGEDTGDATDPEPGSWPHFMSVTAPYLTLWSRYLPGTLN